MSLKALSWLLLICLAILPDSAAMFNMSTGTLNWNIKAQYLMDSIISDCGETKESGNGQIVSHTGATSYSLGIGNIGHSLVSDYSDSVNCTIAIDVSSFGSDYKILVQFDTDIDLGGNSSINCDRLDVYDGDYDTAFSNPSTPLASFCGQEDQPLPLESTGSDLSFRFQTIEDGNAGKGFLISYSAFRTATDGNNCTDDEFFCDQGRCIPADFVCDGTHHCLDETDEQLGTADCSSVLDMASRFLRFGLYAMIGIGVAVLVVLILIIVLCVCCCCKKKSKVRRINIAASA